uniref:ATP-binding protein n=1 Tax=Spirosoma sp. TaxID=1899569 RepID=UPI003B3A51E8
RLDAGKLDRRDCVGDPVAFIAQVTTQLRDLARQRQIDLDWSGASYAVPPDPNEASSRQYRFDDEKLEKITYNLLSNALKFTPAGGQVRVEARISADHHLLLQVSDTGIGIPADQLPRIFERFYQVDNSLTRTHSGTGIGLALVHELTNWLGGTVQVKSTVGKGSCFTVDLPMAIDPFLSVADEEVLDQPIDTYLPLLLIIEDNDELRSYVSSHLVASYRVVTADNGRMGLQQALRDVPDLIVSDVMMPELDGYELVERLKNDERTSHIPIILLTAKASYASRMKGLGAGADDYIDKPFSLEELKLRIGNSLRTRWNWQRRLTTSQSSSELGMTTSDPRLSKEERFLTRLRNLILDHLTNEAVGADWLAAQAGMSRVQLHRKLIALTNQSTTRFIHSVRLAKAVELLQTGEFNVAQVAQAVGYNSQSYFTKVFQEHFGYPPLAIKV